MKTFLSYSINDTDQYILTLLSGSLRKMGSRITLSNDFNINVSQLTKVNIKNSHLFIGILTGNGKEKERVYNEFMFAKESQIPSILIVENTVAMSQNFNEEYILFDRSNPQPAITKLNRKVQSLQKNSNQDSNALAWILGGLAILAIIGMISDD